MGTARLVAVTMSAGPNIWRYEGILRMGVDALMELGPIIAAGKSANENVEESTKLNGLIGAHLAFWLGIPTATRFQPTLLLDAGWIRGLNVFAGDKFLGGFEGPSTSLGIAAVW